MNLSTIVHVDSRGAVREWTFANLPQGFEVNVLIWIKLLYSLSQLWHSEKVFTIMLKNLKSIAIITFSFSRFKNKESHITNWKYRHRKILQTSFWSIEVGVVVLEPTSCTIHINWPRFWIPSQNHVFCTIQLCYPYCWIGVA